MQKFQIDVPRLKSVLKYHQITYEAVANAIGMKRDTFARNLGKGGDFRITEIHAMMEFIPLDMDEMKKIFFRMDDV